jgi:hypothetical protein
MAGLSISSETEVAWRDFVRGISFRRPVCSASPSSRCLVVLRVDIGADKWPRQSWPAADSLATQSKGGIGNSPLNMQLASLGRFQRLTVGKTDRPVYHETGRSDGVAAWRTGETSSPHGGL